jgi:hypothetical protein
VVIDRVYSKRAKMKMLHDRIAIVTAMVGAAFMIVAIWTRVNPVEASVVRPEFLHTSMGQPIAMLLLIASLPGWIGIILAGRLGLPIEPGTVFVVEFFLAQIFIYWLLGNVISIGWRKWRRRRDRDYVN